MSVFSTPDRTSRTGGISMPSWKLSVATGL